MRWCAGSVLTDEGGRVLLLWQPRGKYGLPGGVLEPGETPPRAAVREAKEEVGVDIEIEYLVGMYYVFGGGKPHQVSTVSKARVVAGVPYVAQPSEVSRLEWAKPGTQPSPILNDVRAALSDFWAGLRGVVRGVERLVEPDFR